MEQLSDVESTAARKDVLEHASAYRSPYALMFRRLVSNRLSLVGLVIIAFMATVAIFGPLIAPHDPTAMTLTDRFQSPSTSHLFGTDSFGRDVLSRVLDGAHETIGVGLSVVLIELVVGLIIGLVTGYVGGWLDRITQSLTEIWMSFPSLVLALGIVAMLGPSLFNVLIALGIGGIPYYARLVRGQVLSLRNLEYIEAARAIGARDRRLMFRYVLPNTLSPLIVYSTLEIGWAILAAAGLSFIGLGAQPPSPEWGAMLATGRAYLRESWWIATFPGLAIAITVLGFNLLGDGLRDALDPRRRQ